MHEVDGWSSPSGGLSATSAQFSLDGGIYAVDHVSGNWGGKTATLQILGPDNATYVNAATGWTASGSVSDLYLPRGFYQVLLSGTPTDPIVVRIVRVPGE
jgi:hypothetical protein